MYGSREVLGDGCSGVTPTFFERVMNNLPPLIYGDGRQTRDFTYIDDVVNATLLVADDTKSDFEIFNVGTGVETSVNQLASKIIALCGREGRIKPIHIPCELPAKMGDVRRRCACIGKINKLVGWKPKYSIDHGLKEMLGKLGKHEDNPH